MAQQLHLDQDTLDIDDFKQIEGLEQNVKVIPDADDAKSEEMKHNIDSTEINRFVVLGARGVGKSTLCNVLYGSKEFEIAGPFNNGTQHIHAKRFVYEMDEKAVSYEVIDCPGFFDEECISSAEERDKEFTKRIHQCIDLTKDGVSAYLLVLPFTSVIRYSMIVSLQFVMEYFPENAKPYVWLVITRSENYSIQIIMQQITLRMKAKKHAKIVTKFAQHIQGRVIATECINCNAETLKQYRHDILKSIYDTKMRNGGPYTSQGFWNLFKNLNGRFNQQTENNWTFWATAASAVGAGALAGIAVLKFVAK